ncbi:MAG: hypothetical protein J7J87_01470 [Candidatus Diapherotrites archaeon]|nr:hypothetical protein [Candidatus Diapherotrites archaeon]MCD6478433.1 hypothetical protein [Candidatus Diapherotrites archaeon]
MAIEVREMVKFVKNLGYGTRTKKRSVADYLLGAFEGALPKGVTSTNYIRKLRETGYGKY